MPRCPLGNMSRAIRTATLGLVGGFVLSCVGVSPAGAEWVTRSVELGDLPRGIAVNPVTHKVYVARESAALVTVLDPWTGNTEHIAVGNAPGSIALNPITNRVYVVNQGGNSVSVIDGATNAVTTIAVGSQPYAVAVNPVTNRIYVANRTAGTVSVIDGATNSVFSPVGVGSLPQSVAVNPLTNRIYVANRGSGSVSVIDGTTNTVVKAVTVGSAPYAICANPTTNLIYVVNMASNTVSRIDGATNAATAYSVGAQPYAIAVDPVSNLIYIANAGSGSVTIMNGTTNNRTTIATGSQPIGIAVNSAARRAYVCNLGSGTVSVLDGGSLTLAQTLTVGTAPLCAVVDGWTQRAYIGLNVGSGTGLVELAATTDVPSTASLSGAARAVVVNRRTHKAYVAHAFTNQVSELDLSTLAITPITVGYDARALMVDEMRDKVFTADFASGSVSIIDGATRFVSTVTEGIGSGPWKLAFNARANKLYVGDFYEPLVSVLDVGSSTAAELAVAGVPYALAVNPQTEACYAVSRQSHWLTRIERTGVISREYCTGASPTAVAFDPLWNRVMITCSGDGTLDIRDGDTDMQVGLVKVGAGPVAVWADVWRSRVVTADSLAGTLTFVMQSDLSTQPVAVPGAPVGIAPDLWSGRLYVASRETEEACLVDLGSLAVHVLGLGEETQAAAVDPVLGVTVWAPVDASAVPLVRRAATVAQPLSAAIDPLVDHMSAPAEQVFTGSAVSTRTPNNASVLGVYVSVGGPVRPWSTAGITTGGGASSVTWTTEAIGPGFEGAEMIAMAALDATAATLDNSSQAAGTVYTGDVPGYVYQVPPADLGTLPEWAEETVAGTVSGEAPTGNLSGAFQDMYVSHVRCGVRDPDYLLFDADGSYSTARNFVPGDRVICHLGNDLYKVTRKSEALPAECGELGTLCQGLDRSSGGGPYDFAWPADDAQQGIYWAQKMGREYWDEKLGHPPTYAAVLVVADPDLGNPATSGPCPTADCFRCNFKPDVARYQDAVYHEYAHGMVAQMLGHQLICGATQATCDQLTSEWRALDEGVADYFTAAATGNPTIAEGVPGVSERSLVNPRMTREYCDGAYATQGAYELCQAVGGALWTLRNTLREPPYSVDTASIDRWIYEAIGDLRPLSVGERDLMALVDALKSHPLESRTYTDEVTVAFANWNISVTPVETCKERVAIVNVALAAVGSAFQVTVDWTRAAGAATYALLRRSFVSDGAWLGSEVVIADGLTDTTYTYVEADTASLFAYLVIPSDSAGFAMPTSNESPAVTAVEPGVPGAVGLALSVHPNPSRGIVEFRGVGMAAGGASIEVFDVAGRRVARLRSGPTERGFVVLQWDLNEAVGGRVGPGIYLARLTQGFRHAVTRFIVVH